MRLFLVHRKKGKFTLPADYIGPRILEVWVIFLFYKSAAGHLEQNHGVVEGWGEEIHFFPLNLLELFSQLVLDPY